MFDLIKQIPGPYFLIIYPVYCSIVIIFARIILNNDRTKYLNVPEPTTLTPIEMAFLKGGVKGALIISIFDLWRNKKLEIKRINSNLAMKRISQDAIGLNRLESSILKSCNTRVSYRNFLTQKSIKNAGKILNESKTKLENLGLLVDLKLKKKYEYVTVISICLILLLGVIKFYLGIVGNKPVSFLFILMIISVFATINILKPHKVRHTSLGRKFIKASNQRFEWLKKSNKDNLLEDDNLLYGIAMFGISAFMSTSLGSILGDPLFLEKIMGPYTNSGSSCSGSGCGGSGCSGGGGGCGGGGCGGCGGGD